jgi:nicotinamidase-related amidase
MSPAQALLVVDFQNDFCSPRGAGAGRRGDLSRLEATARNLARALAAARRRGVEVVFIRFLGDRRFQKPNLIARDRRQRKPAKCLEGSWGAEFFRVAPLPGEKVVPKRGRFDPFLDPALDAHLRRRRVGRVLLAGVYLDVCVDATARTAFQKGYEVSVLRDCVESLHYPKDDVLRFMAKYYGARLVSSRRF